MRRFSTFGMVVFLTLGILTFPALAEGDARSCMFVEGEIQGLSIPRFDGEVLGGFDVTVIEVSGPLAGGEITASLMITEVAEDGSLVFDGTHRFVGTEAGTFTTADHGLTTAAGRVADMLTIKDGASGFLVTIGHVDLATGTLVLEYIGPVCTL